MKTLLPATLKQLGSIATDEVGDCIGFRWYRPPTTYRRIVCCYFRSRWAAQQFVRAARRHRCLIFSSVVPERIDAQGQVVDDARKPAFYRVWRATAVAIPDPNHRAGWRKAPPFRDQPGSQRLSDGRRKGSREWWEHEAGDGAAEERDRFDEPDESGRVEIEIDDELERDLERIETEVREWWRRTGREGDPYTYSHRRSQQARVVNEDAPLWQKPLTSLREEAQQHLAQYERQRERYAAQTQLGRDDDEVQAALAMAERQGRIRR